MQKLLNEPEAFVDEAIEGLVAAFPQRFRLLRDQRAIVYAERDGPDRVTIATGGGSGHLPLFVGYVGPGLADGCSIGNLFASPSSEQMLAVTRAIHRGRGVLYLYGNYGGDKLNFELAGELAESEGIAVRSVRWADDVASAPADEAGRRRGIAGIALGYKVAGACASGGADLDSVASIAQRALARTRSIGVSLSSCTLPTVGHPNFDVPPGQMEIGMGIHGEPGVRRGPLRSADEVAHEMIEMILADLDPAPASRLAVLVNGLGATPVEELCILYRCVHRTLTGQGYSVHRAFVGEYATALEMAGASLSLMAVDDELAGYLDHPSAANVFGAT